MRVGLACLRTALYVNVISCSLESFWKSHKDKDEQIESTDEKGIKSTECKNNVM